MLGWKAQEQFETGLAKTVDWYLAHADWLIPVDKLGRLGTRMTELAGASA
jgi:dTDP-glucose 4,6-dehydratase